MKTQEDFQTLLDKINPASIILSGSQAVRQSGSQAVRQSGSQAVRQSGSQAVRQSGSQAVRQAIARFVIASEAKQSIKTEHIILLKKNKGRFARRSPEFCCADGFIVYKSNFIR